MLGATPFVLYWWARAGGSLRSEAEWLELGSNHGPWRWGWQNITIAYPMILLAALTVVASAWLSVTRRAVAVAWRGLALLAAQAALVAAQLAALGWTVD